MNLNVSILFITRSFNIVTSRKANGSIIEISSRYKHIVATIKKLRSSEILPSDSCVHRSEFR